MQNFYNFGNPTYGVLLTVYMYIYLVWNNAVAVAIGKWLVKVLECTVLQLVYARVSLTSCIREGRAIEKGNHEE